MRPQRTAGNDLDLELPSLWDAVLFPFGNARLRQAHSVGRFLLRPEVGNDLIEVHATDYRNSFPVCQQDSDIYLRRLVGI